MWSRAALAVLWILRSPCCSSGGREAPSAVTTAPLGSLSAGCSVGVRREGLAACSRLCSPAKGEGGWWSGWGWGGVARSAWLGLAWARDGLGLAVARMGSSCSARSVAVCCSAWCLPCVGGSPRCLACLEAALVRAGRTGAAGLCGRLGGGAPPGGGSRGGSRERFAAARVTRLSVTGGAGVSVACLA